MARQDLFDQAGAGAGHADDEDRQLGWIASTLLRAHQLGTENRPNSLKHPPRRSLVMNDLLPLQRIPFEEMVKSLPLVPDLGKGFVHREMELDPIFAHERGLVLRQGLQAGKMVVVRS